MSSGRGSISKVPPEFKDGMNYTDWRYDVMVWQKFTDLDVEKQGSALYLSLNGKARECARSIDLEVLGSATGCKKLIEILDKLFLKDADTRAFLAFKEFYEFKRPYDCSVTDFVAHYEYLYGKVEEHKMTLPEEVKAFFPLNAANVTEEQEVGSCNL